MKHLFVARRLKPRSLSHGVRLEGVDQEVKTCPGVAGVPAPLWQSESATSVWSSAVVPFFLVWVLFFHSVVCLALWCPRVCWLPPSVIVVAGAWLTCLKGRAVVPSFLVVPCAIGAGASGCFYWNQPTKIGSSMVGH